MKKSKIFNKMKSLNIRSIILVIFITDSLVNVNTQRSSNGRHRIWWSNDEEPSQSSLTINDDLVINQNVPSKKSEKSSTNNTSSIILSLDDRSINLASEPLAAEIVKVDLSNLNKKSAMLLVSSNPTYLLTNYTDREILKKGKTTASSNEKNINFVATKRTFDTNKSKSKFCLSTLDCDLELNERCLSPNSEEMLYFDELTKVQLYTSIYSQYLRKRWKTHKMNDFVAMKSDFNTTTENFKNSINGENLDQPICGCASPSFVRNQVTGQCELMRVVELKFKLRTDRTRTTRTTNHQISEQNFEKQSNHQLKLDALGQIDHVIKNSDSLQDIVHHFRLTKLTPSFKKNKNLFTSNAVGETSGMANDDGENENEENKIKKRKKKRRSIESLSSKLIRMQNQYIARGLLFLFSSEYTANFDLLFTNEYCSTQNTLRLKAQEKMFHQTLAAANQTMPIRFNTIRSADFFDEFLVTDNKNEKGNRKINSLRSIKLANSVNQSLDRNKNRSKNRPIEVPLIHHRRKREMIKNSLDNERYGLDVQLIEVNSDQINICKLNTDYGDEQLSDARRKYQLDRNESKENDETKNQKINHPSMNIAEQERLQKKLDYERRFFRLTYCDDSRAFCESLPQSRAGYICVCHDNLMDLSPIPELPGEYCGVKCPNKYCGSEGFCHVRNSVGNYPSPDHDLATQQRFLSTAGRMMSFLNGKLSKEKKDRNSTKLEREDDETELELADYQSLIDEHKKNQTLLRQRYYAAIYSVQQRFTQLFENIQAANLIDPKTSKISKTTNKDSYKFDYTYSFVQTPQLVTFYCTCPGWTMGSRCQFSGWMILLVLGILVILLALIVICTISMLCTPGRSNRRESTKSDKSDKSLKSNLNTASLTISETSDSLDMETSSQQYNSQSQQQQHHQHNQFNNPQNRQRRASEFVNDKRSSFGLNNQQPENSNKSICKQPAFKIIHATPPHSMKDAQKIQFTDTITEIPYYSPYASDISQISSQVQMQPTNQFTQKSNPQHLSKNKQSKIPIMNTDYTSRPDINECKFELYKIDVDDQHVYNTINDQDEENNYRNENLNDDNQINSIMERSNKKENTTQTPNIYASDGQLRIESEKLLPSNSQLQIERRSVGSQTSGFESSDPSLAYLSAISLKQFQFDQQQQRQKAFQKSTSNQLPTTSLSGPIVWF